MRRIVLFLAGLGLLLASLLAARPAFADSGDDRIDRYDVTANVAPDGTTSVRVALDFNFGGDSGHGFYLTLPLRQEIGGDPDHWRMLDVTLGQVTSPSGASPDVQRETKDGNLLVRVGNENQTWRGVQRYVVEYRIRGLIASRQAQSGLDEFNWNAVGGGWEVPFRNVQVSVTGPADISKVACFVADLHTPCEAGKATGRTATFRQRSLDAETPLQVVAGFPPGTFTGAEPRLERRLTVANMFPITPVTGGLAAVLTAVALVPILRRARRGSRDEVYLGLTPGVTPAANQAVSTGVGAGNTPVAVAFTPPRGARPAEIGVLTDAAADNVDITATIVDLAVRGHLRIEQQGKKDWTFVRLDGQDRLNGYESHLISELFQSGSEVTTDELRSRNYAGVVSGTQQRLYDRVTKELKWFRRNPSHVRGLVVVAGIVLILVGAGLGVALGLIGFGLVGVAGVICGLVVLALNNRFGVRTAEGSAVLAQAKGFELYLTTAEADQIKFEEGIDVFSRYLPYAIVFGVAERWAKIFQELAARGGYVADSSWYYGYGYGALLDSSFASSMDRLSSTMSSSMQSATTASSGGSGFSGGGGFGGGGGGGW